jgi:hypothetical protein
MHLPKVYRCLYLSAPVHLPKCTGALKCTDALALWLFVGSTGTSADKLPTCAYPWSRFQVVCPFSTLRFFTHYNEHIHISEYPSGVRVWCALSRQNTLKTIREWCVWGQNTWKEMRELTITTLSFNNIQRYVSNTQIKVCFLCV